MPTHPRDERDVRVELRMARREALSPPRRIDAFIAERALRDALGGSRVMVEQLRHLAEVAAKPNVSLRVLPSDLNRWTLAHDGAFVLYEFPKASPIVHLEHYRGPAFLYDVRDVNSYLRAVATLGEVALDHDESVDLLAAVRSEMERGARV